MSISTIRRQVKNVALNYTNAQVKVREATSNDPWGPTTALMSEIADMTHDPIQFNEIMSVIWKRLNDHGKNWRHVYKSMVLLDYLIKCGSERVAQQCKENIFSVETLKDFQHIEENRDQGLNVRTKAKQMVALLTDDEKLKNERARFMLTRKRFMNSETSGISSDGTRRAGTSRRRTIDSNGGPVDPEFEEARPSSLGEEEMQLQIALALSKEECEKEQEMRRGDDVRLQIAIEESRREMAARSSSLSSPTGQDSPQKPSTSKSQGALNNLLSLGLDEVFSKTAENNALINMQQPAQNDPWSPRPSTTIPMMAGGIPPPSLPFNDSTLISSSAQNDPWAAPAIQPVTTTKLPTTSERSQELEDIFGCSSQTTLNQPLPLAPNNDPWAAFENQNIQNNSTPTQQNGTKIGQQRNKIKTPESFLGENSGLVNLDNLLGPTGSQVPKKATNPFLIGSAASAAAATKNNPFLANERPSPSLNEMLQAKQGGGGFVTNGGNISGQTTVPSNSAPNNAFNAADLI
uniref:ENTH domain-containing protein n=1 Tax=Meloidogyne javanica TaxID=6303 RepID=A0A915MM53_MELJA